MNSIKDITNEMLRQELKYDIWGIYKILDTYINSYLAINESFWPEHLNIYEILDIENKELFDSLIEEKTSPMIEEKQNIILKYHDPTESLYHLVHDNNHNPMPFKWHLINSGLKEFAINCMQDNVSKSIWTKYNLESLLEKKPIYKSKKI